MATTQSGKKDGRGVSAQQAKEIRELKQALDAEKRRREYAESRQRQDIVDRVVWADKLQDDFRADQKSAFINDNRSTLKALLMYADESKRLVKKVNYDAVNLQAREAFEAWMRGITGGYDWCVKDLSVIEGRNGRKHNDVKDPSLDSLEVTFAHPGYVKSKIGSTNNIKNSLTPQVTDIKVRVKVRRYEVEA